MLPTSSSRTRQITPRAEARISASATSSAVPPVAPDVEHHVAGPLCRVDIGDDRAEDILRVVDQFEGIARQRGNPDRSLREPRQRFAFLAELRPVDVLPGFEVVEPLEIGRVDSLRAARPARAQAGLADGQVDQRAAEREDQNDRQPGQRDAHRAAAHDDPRRQADAEQQIGDKQGDRD